MICHSFPFIDCEIRLTSDRCDVYGVELRITTTGNKLRNPVFGQLQLDSEILLQYQQEPSSYGGYLTKQLFGENPNIAQEFEAARAQTETINDCYLRLRLVISPVVTKLHDLRWETLRDPRNHDRWLITNLHIHFSRFLADDKWEEHQTRPRDQLCALVAIANPRNLAEYNLAPIDIEGELDRAHASLSNITIHTLANQIGSDRVTLTTLVERLRAGVDILYLVCHGKLQKNGEPQLCLEDDDGMLERISGSILVEHLHDLAQRPQLIVLASCQSAGTGQEPINAQHGALTALGPQLIYTGVPSVLAMQGNILGHGSLEARK